MTETVWMSGSPKPHPEFLDHRSHRPWQVHTCRPAAYPDEDSHGPRDAGMVTPIMPPPPPPPPTHTLLRGLCFHGCKSGRMPLANSLSLKTLRVWKNGFAHAACLHMMPAGPVSGWHGPGTGAWHHHQAESGSHEVHGRQWRGGVAIHMHASNYVSRVWLLSQACTQTLSRTLTAREGCLQTQSRYVSRGMLKTGIGC